MTFINRLVDDMGNKLASYAEVKTFHSYCKKILHEQNGRVNLVPYLTKIIENDANLLEEDMRDFDLKFQTLDESSPAISFYLQRGDYYQVVSFNDAVYRLYKQIQKNPDIVPAFDQIVIDEYQDFNPLEVAFIREIERHGSILIVGDDDQAVYSDRAASPKYIRDLHASGQYAIFELPFCNRCTEVIVGATNEVIKKAQSKGYLSRRVPKSFECFLEDKKSDSMKYPRIIHAQCTLANVIPKYIAAEISKIDQKDIDESNNERYPTVLIVGQKQYLHETYEKLRKQFAYVDYTPSTEISYALHDGYEQLLYDKDSNLGWRILMEWFFEDAAQRKIIAESQKGAPVVDLFEQDFVSAHLSVVEIVRELRLGKSLTDEQVQELKKILGNEAQPTVDYFTRRQAEKVEERDKTKPTILLTSYVGCKGLSAGHVFIVGANNGSLPANPRRIEDIEVCKFVVALTRTRKQCHLVSTKWLIAPVNRRGEYQPAFEKSEFISWIPSDLIEDRGLLKAKDFAKK